MSSTPNYEIVQETHHGRPGRNGQGSIWFEWAIYDGLRLIFRARTRDDADTLLRRLRTVTA